jgi:hypothetical protein
VQLDKLIRKPGRCAFTIAMGRPIYFEMAAALVRSFRLWHGRSDIGFVLVTDRDGSFLPADLADLSLIQVAPGSYGQGFTPKLHLDRFAPTDHSMFIDADCLCVGPLDAAFDKFEHHAVSVVGRNISAGEWFGDVAAVCRQFQIAAMPRFNGGVYYLEPGHRCSQVYETARSLLPRYDEIGFRRLRGHPNDEVLISLGMALTGESPIEEHGDVMNSLLAAPGGLEIDVFKGEAVLYNPLGHPGYNEWYGMEELRPKLVHFLGSDSNTYPYRQEIIRLRLVFERALPPWLATLWSKLTFSWPWLAKDKLKHLLRPLYHVMFKPRRVQPSARM